MEKELYINENEQKIRERWKFFLWIFPAVTFLGSISVYFIIPQTDQYRSPYLLFCIATLLITYAFSYFPYRWAYIKHGTIWLMTTLAMSISLPMQLFRMIGDSIQSGNYTLMLFALTFSVFTGFFLFYSYKLLVANMAIIARKQEGEFKEAFPEEYANCMQQFEKASTAKELRKTCRALTKKRRAYKKFFLYQVYKKRSQLRKEKHFKIS